MDLQESLDIMCRRCSQHEMCMCTGCEPRRTIEKLIEKQEQIVHAVNAKAKMCERLFLRMDVDDILKDKRPEMFKCIRSEIIAHNEDAIDSVKKIIDEPVTWVNGMYEVMNLDKVRDGSIFKESDELLEIKGFND